nr:hypothetical protein [Tanacetum cinerariifolium]
MKESILSFSIIIAGCLGGKPCCRKENWLVPQSSDTKVVCTKGDDGEVMFIEIIRKNDDSRKEEPDEEGIQQPKG